MVILSRILVVGRLVSVIVNTDSNCSSRSSAFPLLSLTRLVPFFNGAIPPESWRLDLMYFQNGFVSLLFRPSKMLS